MPVRGATYYSTNLRYSGLCFYQASKALKYEDASLKKTQE
jgi:hypothetical protein